MGLRSIMLPLMIFFLEGIVFYNVYASTGTVWYDLMLTNYPMPNLTNPLEWVLFGLTLVGWVVLWIAITILKTIGLLGVFGSIMSIPFSVMAQNPILLAPHIVLIIWFGYGIISSIKIAGSGVESEE